MTPNWNLYTLKREIWSYALLFHFGAHLFIKRVLWVWVDAVSNILGTFDRHQLIYIHWISFWGDWIHSPDSSPPKQCRKMTESYKWEEIIWWASRPRGREWIIFLNGLSSFQPSSVWHTIHRWTTGPLSFSWLYEPRRPQEYIFGREIE